MLDRVCVLSIMCSIKRRGNKRKNARADSAVHVGCVGWRNGKESHRMRSIGRRSVAYVHRHMVLFASIIECVCVCLNARSLAGGLRCNFIYDGCRRSVGDHSDSLL